jgi:hypothetical protein
MLSGSGFVVAMFGELAVCMPLAPAGTPQRFASWFIVSRFGDAGEYLSLAVAAAEFAGPEAPSGLLPTLTRLGMLLPATAVASEARFSLLRQLPPQIEVAGKFRPAEGLACLELSVRLTAKGCDPDTGALWQIIASRRPWPSEFARR